MKELVFLHKNLSASGTPDAIFSALLPALSDTLKCDRCFLYVRHPQTNIGKVVSCWCRSPEYPDVTDSDWKAEPVSLANEDPLFAAALRTAPSIFVEDVETADPEVVNKDFEHKTFGHRALIHAHLCYEDRLWGILQPCVFGQPRVWTDADRAIISAVIDMLTPIVIDYVKAKWVGNAHQSI